MIEIFTESFSTMLGAVGRIFLIIVGAGFLVRKKVLTDDHVKVLSKVTVNILLPSMIFSKITKNFNAGEVEYWWLIPLACSTMIFIGIGYGYLFYLRKYKEKQFLIPLASMQNAIYLVLPIGMFMYPTEFDRFAVYNFLYILGFMPVVWSIGKVMITGDSFRNLKWKELVTPPLATALGTLLVAILGIQKYFPAMVVDSIDLIGDATVPVSNIVLGATLGSVSLKILPRFSDIFKLSLIKFVLMPLTVIGLLHLIGLKETNPLLANLFVIESAAAPATALVLQIRAYGGDKQTIGSLMLIQYIICLLAIPFWVGVWQMV